MRHGSSCVAARSLLIAAIPLLVALSSCPSRFRGFGEHGRITDPQIILDFVKAHRASVHSVQGDAKAYLTTPKGSGKLAQYLVAEAPARLRIESLSFFGDPIAVLTSNGDRFALHEIKENRFFEGAATPENVSRLIPLLLPGDEIVSLILGVAPLLPDARVVGFELDLHEGVYRLTLAASAAVEILSVDTSTLAPVRVDMASRPELSAYRAELEDYDGKLGLPDVVRLLAPDGNTKIELKWKSREVNEAPDPDVFVQAPPRGVPRTLL